MGRLDEHAKKRIVELRKAGLSFRKIKKVLELDNIRVTPQAVYLFLKRKNVEPEQSGGTTGSQQVRGSRNPWEDEQLWNLLNDGGSEQNKRKDLAASTAAGQQGLGRQQSPDTQQGLVRQHGPEGQQVLMRQQGSDHHQGFGRQHVSEGQQGLARQHVTEMQQGLGRQVPEAQQCVGWQQSHEGQQTAGRKQSLDGQQSIGRQQGPDGYQGIGRQQSIDGQQSTGRQQGSDGQHSVARQHVSDGHQSISRQQCNDAQQGLLRQQGPDGQQGSRSNTQPSGGGAANHELSDNKDDIKIVSVTSLSENGHQFGKASAPMAPGPGMQLQPHPKKSDCPVSSASQPPISVSHSPPVATINHQQQLNGRGRMPFIPPRNPALIVRKKIVDRAIHLQKKVNIQNGQAMSGSTAMLPYLVGAPLSNQSPRMNHATLPPTRSMGTPTTDASTQTIPTGAACSTNNQNSHWGGHSKAIAEKLEVVHTEVQKLTQALHAMAERQNRLERQHEQQQHRFQQEVLGTLQQMNSLLSQQQQQHQQQQQQQLCHAQSPLNQACLPYSNMAENAPVLPSFGQFKMELL
ncbi:hypothetical protein NDU88_003244 [Pleurodeles waltl]|uniref:Uncharacterized protein n=1 Tax=Pleurodeles waltl TaxID=8319 RepID=A0AAV7MAH5_PLEWA|nr:hypothetical protein NDU88_003244 [Pleurodeles waltl]